MSATKEEKIFQVEFKCSIDWLPIGKPCTKESIAKWNAAIFKRTNLKKPKTRIVEVTTVTTRRVVG